MVKREQREIFMGTTKPFATIIASWRSYSCTSIKTTCRKAAVRSHGWGFLSLGTSISLSQGVMPSNLNFIALEKKIFDNSHSSQNSICSLFDLHGLASENTTNLENFWRIWESRFCFFSLEDQVFVQSFEINLPHKDFLILWRDCFLRIADYYTPQVVF